MTTLAPTLTLDAAPPRAAAARPRAAYWLLALVMALFASGLVGGRHMLDPDLFWHLRVADRLLADGVGPIVDAISYNSIDRPWTPYSWLAELMLRDLWDAFGPAGAPVIASGCFIAFGLTLALACEAAATDRETNEINRVAAAVGVIVGLMFAACVFSFRPVDFSLVLLMTAAALLWRDARQPTRSVWLVPAIAAICVNVHLYAIFLPPMALAYAIKRPTRRHFALFGLTALGCLTTPMLPGALATSAHYFAADPMVASGIIVEMLPFWATPWNWVIWIGLVATAGGLAPNWRRVHWIDAAAVLLAVWLTCRHVRFAPLLAVVAAPTIAAALPVASDRLFRRPLLLKALAGLLIVGVIGAVADHATRTDRFESYPATAAAYVDRHVTPTLAGEGRLVNEFNWGGYLAWRLGEEYQVFVDGRTQLYPAEFWEQTYLGDHASRAAVIAEANADVAIVPTSGSWFRESIEQLGWRRVHADATAEVWLPPGGPGSTPAVGDGR